MYSSIKKARDMYQANSPLHYALLGERERHIANNVYNRLDDRALVALGRSCLFFADDTHERRKQCNVRHIKEPSFTFKIHLVGDQGAGKSCLLLRFADGIFTAVDIDTIGTDYKNKTVAIPGQANEAARLQIWDPPRPDRFRTIPNALINQYSGHGIILVFDLTDWQSCHYMKDWLATVDRQGGTNAVKVIVGCKSDLVDERVVDANTVKMFIESLDRPIPYFEVSAKENINVDELFFDVARRCHKEFAPIPAPASSKRITRLSPGIMLPSPKEDLDSMINQFNTAGVTITNFNIKRCNQLIAKANPDKDTINDQLISALKAKVDLIRLSNDLTKLTAEKNALTNIRNKLSSIQTPILGFLPSKIKIATPWMTEIDKLIDLLNKEIMPLASIRNMHEAFLELQKIDLSWLDKLGKSTPQNLFDDVQAASIHVIGQKNRKDAPASSMCRGISKLIQTDLIKLRDFIKAGSLGLELNKEQTKALDQLDAQSKKCIDIANKIPKEVTLADACRCLAGDNAPAPNPNHPNLMRNFN